MKEGILVAVGISTLLVVVLSVTLLVEQQKADNCIAAYKVGLHLDNCGVPIQPTR